MITNNDAVNFLLSHNIFKESVKGQDLGKAISSLDPLGELEWFAIDKH